ncbi:MAG: hypothetical protein AAF430_03100 [Myxococcota bacterium]
MSDAPETIPTPALLEAKLEAAQSAATADLTALLGKAVEFLDPEIATIETSDVADSDAPVIHQLCQSTGTPPYEIHIVIPRPEAVQLAALQMGEEADEGREFDAEVRAAFGVVTKLILSTHLAPLEEDGVPEAEAKDAREIPEPASDPTWIIGERFVRVRYRLVIEGQPDGRCDILWPSGDATVAAEAGDGGVLCVFSDDEDEQVALEDLAAELDWPVSLLAPHQTREEWQESFDHAIAIVVPWQLGGRAGLDLAESFLGDPVTSQIPVLLSSEAPTEFMVRSALRAGAHSFLIRPYRADELRARILGSSSPAETDEGEPANEDAA